MDLAYLDICKTTHEPYNLFRFNVMLITILLYIGKSIVYNKDTVYKGPFSKRVQSWKTIFLVSLAQFLYKLPSFNYLQKVFNQYFILLIT